eukprot:CAMPEP_0203677524 /NCGR_PEP_ID=MMETSP0090-20130426/28510_1 /ASSEMBLY_ACC=CAM_ASM_001088 /TAXON_ID=426623 /ORGANISM="Chaetoceros affinis, Strain CCMP159" /LENGTH=136 /DNA_ID=CAMNT_0050544435 /DNA_START=450 /DNA_END=860 /DNA_ORIENTATION=-
MEIVDHINAVEGDQVDLNVISEDSSASEISLKWKFDPLTLSGNTLIYRLLSKMKNKVLYPESAVDAALVDHALELADDLSKGLGNPKNPIFDLLLRKKEPFECDEGDGEVRVIESMDLTVADIVVKHEVKAALGPN